MPRTGKDKGAALHDRFLRFKKLVEARKESRFAGLLEELVLARQIIDPDRLQEEPAFEQERFIQYRYLTPYQATELFAREYDFWWRWYMEQLGIRRARGPSHSLAIRKDRIISGLWRARQTADALGMPYGVFIKSGMEQMLQESGKKRLPMPNQLAGSAQIERAIEVWSDVGERYAVRVFEDDWDARFFVENYTGDPVQIAAFDCMDQRIEDVVKLGSSRVGALSKFLNRTMPEGEARRRYGDEMVDEALASLARRGGHPPRPEALSEQTYIPGCFGYGQVPGTLQCDGCEAGMTCTQFQDAIAEALVSRTGTDDPRGNKLRESNRLRQAAYRRRKRGETTPEVIDVPNDVTSGFNVAPTQ